MDLSNCPEYNKRYVAVLLIDGSWVHGKLNMKGTSVYMKQAYLSEENSSTEYALMPKDRRKRFRKIRIDPEVELIDDITDLVKTTDMTRDKW